MSAEVVLSIYGAVLATALALAQLGSWWSRRVKLEIVTGVEHRPISEDERETVRGTPMQVARGNDLLWEEMLIAVEIRNTGGTRVQVVAIVVESVESGIVSTVQIVPSPLPSVLEPGTRVECSIQKEFLDLASGIVFFGVVDALGRRFAPAKDACVRTILTSWDTPSRVARFRRRGDDASEPVSAFQARDRAQMSSPRPARRRERAIVLR